MLDLDGVTRIDQASVSWMIHGAPIYGFRPNMGSPKYSPATQTHNFVATGNIRVSVDAEGYFNQSKLIFLSGKRKELSFRLSKSQGVEVQLEYLGQRMKIEEFLAIELLEIGNLKSVERSRQWSDHKLTIFSKPGRYRLRIPSFPGYEDIAEKVVIVKPESITPVLIKLEKGDR